MRYGSVCSGIEAATGAWHPLGWTPAFFSEIEAFPRAVLAHHYPEVPLHGDFTTIKADQYGPIDLLVGGTPCQSFSVAGLRGGLADDRGNLALEFLRLADRTRARWLVWENVPGVLSSNGGRDFGSILGGLVELGYGFAYRVLDAQFFGVPQRRRRVFVVGYLGDWRRAAAVLFERHSLSGHSAPRRQTGKDVAPTISARPTGGGGLGTDFDLDGGLISQGYGGDVAPTLNAAFGSKLGLDNQHIDSGAGLFVAHSLRGEGFDASEDGTGRGTPLVPVAIQGTVINRHDKAGPQGPGYSEDGLMYTLTKADQHAVAYDMRGREGGAQFEGPHDTANIRAASGGSSRSYVAFQSSQSGVREVDTHATLDANNGSRRHNGVFAGSAVRRLTPEECEKLQGFPPGYTAVTHRGKPAADGPRYKALGNSMAVPCMRFLGERIALIVRLTAPLAEAAE